jgi:hypothetical protein
MDFSEFFERSKKILFMLLIVFGFGYFFWVVYLEATEKRKTPEFFSGFLGYEDRLECGLLRAYNGDHYGCRFSGDMCTTLRKYHDQRIRLSAFRVPCGPEAEIFCSEKLDFNEEGFEPDICFAQWQFVAKLTSFFDRLREEKKAPGF